MPDLHTHTLQDPENGETIVLNPADGDAHVHTGQRKNGQEFRTDHRDGLMDHTHVANLGDGVLVQTTPTRTVVPTVALKSYPDVLTLDAVRADRMPPLGESGLPKSLENDIPGKFRYWECKSEGDARAVRRALVQSGIVAQKNLREIAVREAGEVTATELRRVVLKETSELVIPPVENGDPIIPVQEPGIDEAIRLAGLDGKVVKIDASVVELFGFDQAIERVEGSANDWVIEVSIGSVAHERMLKRYDRGTAFRLHTSNDAVYLTSGIPDDESVRWECKADSECASHLLSRQNLSPREIATIIDDGAAPEHVLDVAEYVHSIAAKREWTDHDNRVASRAVVLIQRELAKGADASGDVLRSLGVDVHKACYGLAERVGEIQLRKSAIHKDEERIVYGVVLEPHVADLQGDVMSPDDIRKAAHDFMEYSAKPGLQHAEIITGRAVILETFIAPNDFDADGDPIRKGTWVMCYRIRDDELWTAVKRGEITGFSIGGQGRRIPLETA